MLRELRGVRRLRLSKRLLSRRPLSRRPEPGKKLRLGKRRPGLRDIKTKTKERKLKSEL